MFSKKVHHQKKPDKKTTPFLRKSFDKLFETLRELLKLPAQKSSRIFWAHL
jgi:hypothetical protein